MKHKDVLELERERDLHKCVFNTKIKQKKRELHKRFMEQHKGKVRLLDIAMVLIILFNIGALVITGIMVNESDPGHQVKEANPSACAFHKLECHPQAMKIISLFFGQIFFYTIMISMYLLLRYGLTSKTDFYYLGFIVLFYLVATSFDFFNNFGFFIGKIIYGG